MRLRTYDRECPAQGSIRPFASVAEWALGFESPKAVYESGPTGPPLPRPEGAGVDCAVGASQDAPPPPTAGARTTGATPSGSARPRPPQRRRGVGA